MEITANDITAREIRRVRFEGAREIPRKMTALPGAADDKKDTLQIKTGEEIVKKIEEIMDDLASQTGLKMYYDNEADRVVVTITNSRTGEVVRQIPSSDFLAFVKRLKQYAGLLVDRRV